MEGRFDAAGNDIRDDRIATLTRQRDALAVELRYLSTVDMRDNPLRCPEADWEDAECCGECAACRCAVKARALLAEVGAEEKPKPTYNPPTVTPVGNVKDLVGQSGASDLDCSMLPPNSKPPWCP